MITGIFAGLFGLVMLCGAGWLSLRREQVALRIELDELKQHLPMLEQSAQQIESARIGFTRSIRAQALQLLRSGMSADTAATTLGLPRNELRLLAAVSRALKPV
jgi:hypothetical protein